MPITVLVAEDHGIVRQGIVSILHEQDDLAVIAEACDGLEAVELHAIHEPDVALIDLRMPNLDGVDTIARICERSPNAKILILSTYDTDEDIYRGIQAGAKGFLLKDADYEDLIDAVQTVNRNQRYLSPPVALKLAERMCWEELTEREHEVLTLMVQGSNTNVLADKLNLSEGTIKFHINHIFQKLGVNDRTQAVVVALRRGLARLGDA